jgi:hypothetical protein
LNSGLVAEGVAEWSNWGVEVFVVAVVIVVGTGAGNGVGVTGGAMVGVWLADLAVRV